MNINNKRDKREGPGFYSKCFHLDPKLKISEEIIKESGEGFFLIRSTQKTPDICGQIWALGLCWVLFGLCRSYGFILKPS